MTKFLTICLAALACFLVSAILSAQTQTQTRRAGNNVVGWSKQSTRAGDFKSLIVLAGGGTTPAGDPWTENQIYAVVERTINGNESTLIEMFTPLDWGSDNDYCWFVDAAGNAGATGDDPDPPLGPEGDSLMLPWEQSYAAANSTAEISNSIYVITDSEIIGSASMCLSVNEDPNEVVYGESASIVQRDADGNYDSAYYVPDGGWPGNMDAIRGLQYSHDGESLYAAMVYTSGATAYTRVYKFEVSTGDEIWNNSATDWAWGAYALGIDSSDNVYVPYTGGIYKVLGTDGSTSTDYSGKQSLMDVWIDEDLDMLLSVGSHWEFPVPNTVWQIQAFTLSDGTFLWSKEFELNSLKYMWAVVVKNGSIYCSGDRMEYESGVFGSVFKLDPSDGTVEAAYDTGYRAQHLWFDHDYNIAVIGDNTGGSVDNHIYVLDDDLNLLNTYDYLVAGIFGGEVQAVPEGVIGTNVPGSPIPGDPNTYYYADHLILEEVCVYADGVSLGNFTVDANGELDLGAAYTVVIAGINYWSKLETVPLQVGPRLSDKKLSAIRFDLKDSYYLEYAMGANSTPIVCDFEEVITSVVSYKRVTFPFGSLQKPTVFVQTDKPVPLGVRAIIPELTWTAPW